MTQRGQAVTNPRISAGATFVVGLTFRLGVWFVWDFHSHEWKTAAAFYLTSVNHINDCAQRRALQQLLHARVR
jgi:hypothetical protein